MDQGGSTASGPDPGRGRSQPTAGRIAGPSRPLIRRRHVTTASKAARAEEARKLSTFVRQVGHGFVESAASLIGLLVQAAVGSSGGVGGLRTNRSGWAA